MDNNREQQGSKLGSGAGNFLKGKLKGIALKMALKAAVKVTKALVAAIVKMLAPILIPTALLLFVIWAAYAVVVGIPRDIMETASQEFRDRFTIAAFFGVDEDDPLVDYHITLLDDYREVAGRWSEGLTDEQKGQVITHKFPWSLLLAVDRVVNDMTVWEGGENVEPDPEGVFEELRPVFRWQDSTVTIETVTYSWDDEGNVSRYVYIDTQIVSLIVQANTIAGEFTYSYRWVTNTRPLSCGGHVSTTEEILDTVTSPEVFFVPLKEFLYEKRSIDDELTFDLIMELSFIHDPVFLFHHHLLLGFDLANFDLIEGMYDWLWPTPSTNITSPFGPRRSGMHTGIDVGALRPGVAGDPVWAMTAGRVTRAEFCTRSGFGNVVFIDHGNGIVTVYAHLHTIVVRQGDTVDRGDLVGTMGNTGNSTAAHLHFEVRINGSAVNPALFFAGIR